MNTQEIIAELQRALDHPMAAGRIIRDLIDSLSDPFATVAVYNGRPGDGDVTPDVFDVVMTSPGQVRINVIKVIREILECGLKESKEMTDADDIGRFHSRVVKGQVGLEEARDIQRKLERVGASITVMRHAEL